MTRFLLMVAVVLLMAGPPARSLAADSPQDDVTTDRTLEKDKAKDDACECCQKCKAAKSTIKSEEKEGGKLKDGCEDCCARCGEVLKPAPEATPPEKIEKKVMPPEAEEDSDD